MIGRLVGSEAQNARIRSPLSNLQHLARFRPGPFGIAKNEQATVQPAERTYPGVFQPRGKGLPQVENGQCLLLMFIRRDQFAELKKADAAREVGDH